MLVSLIISAEITDCYGFNVLAAQLKKLPDVKVQIFYIYHKFDEYYPQKTIEDLVDLCKGSDLVGLSVLSSAYRNTGQVSRALRTKLDCPIVWGGKHPTCDPESCFKYADIVALGEGEETFFELAENIKSGKSYDTIQGLWVRQGDAIIKNPRRPVETNLDKYLFPDYSLHNKFILDRKTMRIRKAVNDDLNNMRRWYPTMITRGCPNFCTFCTNSTDKTLREMRSRSIGNVIEEVKQFLCLHPDTQRVFFRDDCISAMPLEFIEEFSERWKKEIGLPCSCSGVIATSENFEEKIALLCRAGFTHFKMGIQSGCQRVRRKVYARTGETDEVIIKAVSALKSLCKDKVNYYMITDNPYESEDELIKSIRFTGRLPRPFSLSLYSLAFYPGTALYNRALRHNIIKDKQKVLLKSIMDFKDTYLNKVFITLKYFELPPVLADYMTRKEVYSKQRYQRVFNALYRFFFRQDVPNRWIKAPSIKRDKINIRNGFRMLVWVGTKLAFQIWHRCSVSG